MRAAMRQPGKDDPNTLYRWGSWGLIRIQLAFVAYILIAWILEIP